MFEISCWLHGTCPPMRSGKGENLFATLLTFFGEMRKEARGRNDVLDGVMTFKAQIYVDNGWRLYHGTMRIVVSGTWELQMPTIEWHANGVRM